MKNLTIRRQYMYEREDAQGIIRLAKARVLKLRKSAGHNVTGQFSFEGWENAVETAKQNPESGNIVLFTPSENSSFGRCWDF